MPDFSSNVFRIPNPLLEKPKDLAELKQLLVKHLKASSTFKNSIFFIGQKCCVSGTGKKDIIKIDREFDVNLDLVGFVSPEATVVVIKNGEIVEKKKLDLPEVLINVIRCKKPRCISMTEQEIVHEFRLSDRANRVYRCVYCETKAN